MCLRVLHQALNTRALITGAMRRLTETYSWESIVADTTILCDSVEKSFPPQTELMVLFESRGQPPPVVVPGASGGADDSKSTSLMYASPFLSILSLQVLTVLCICIAAPAS